MVVVNLSDPLQSLGVIGAVSGVHVVQPGGEGGHGEVLVLGGEDDQGDGEREEPDGEDGSKYDWATTETSATLSPPSSPGKCSGEELLIFDVKSVTPSVCLP